MRTRPSVPLLELVHPTMASSHTSGAFDGPLVAGRYKLGRLLGSGAQGQTHVAMDTRTDARVAVKVLPLNTVKDWKQLDLFRRECRVLKELNHPGIPRYLEECTSEDGGSSYLVMELVQGRTLREVVKEDGPLSEAELWRILWQMAQILEFLHSRNPPVVHRDVKPHNIIRRDDGEMVLVDFGVVQQAPRGEGTFVGTFGFMAPEQFHGESSPATDVYGLGATLISLASGMEPEDLPHEGLRLKFQDRVNLSDRLVELLSLLVEPEPARRPRDGRALKQLLEASMERPREGPADVPFDDGDGPHLPPPVGMVMGAMLIAVGTLGTVGLTILHTAILPMIVTILAMVLPEPKRRQLREHEQTVKHVLQVGTGSFRQLAAHGVEELDRNRRRMTPHQLSGRASREELRARAGESEAERQRRLRASRARDRVRNS